jgi:Protein of unknown function (DUF4238)
MSVAKRHHTVPQFYLRGFSSDDQLVTVRLPGKQRFVQSIRKAAAEMNFYAVEGHEDGPDAFEKLLSSVEGEAAKVFRMIADGVWPLEPEDRGTVAYFIALQAVRGPEQRRNMEHLAAQVARLEIGYGGRAKVADWVQRNRGISVSEEQAGVIWQEATRPGGPPIRVQPIAHIEQIVELSEALLPYIVGRPWTLVRFDKRSLVTCDTPVGLVPHGDHEPWSGVGFMTAWGVTYPLTRKLGLLMTDGMMLADAGVTVDRVQAGSFDHTESGTARMEKFFNQFTVGSASLWLYHHPEDERFLPDTLPQPSQVTMGMAGEPRDFSSEPIVGPIKADEDEPVATE